MKSKSGLAPNDAVGFINLGRLGDELIAINAETGRINRIETGDLESTMRLGAFTPITMSGLNRHHLVDQGRPELIGGGSLSRTGASPRRRRLRALLEQNCVNENAPLLGSSGPSIAYAQLDGNRPSVALVKLSKRLAFERNQRSNRLSATFPFHNHLVSFPLLDARALATFPSEETRIERLRDLEVHLGFRPGYLLLALAKVHSGYCKKVVVAVLPDL